MKLLEPIGKTIKFFARARDCHYSAQQLDVTPVKTGVQWLLMFWIPAFAGMTMSISLAFAGMTSALAQEPQFIRGSDSTIYGIVLDHSSEATTRQQMQIMTDCLRLKNHATAMALVGSEGASVTPYLHSTRGIVVLEGLRSGAETKILDTEFLSPYRNIPTSIPGEMTMQPSPRYPLALTLAAQFNGEGDLVLQQGDYVVIHADGQLYVYSLPAITIPSEGLLTLYLGTDDTLYYDAAFRHRFHSGACGGMNK